MLTDEILKLLNLGNGIIITSQEICYTFYEMQFSKQEEHILLRSGIVLPRPRGSVTLPLNLSIAPKPHLPLITHQ